MPTRARRRFIAPRIPGFLVLLLITLCFVPARAADTLDFTGRLGAIAPENMFYDPGHLVWCGSGIRGEGGKYCLFYARWQTGSEGRAPGDKELFKGMKGWLKYSEIAAAEPREVRVVIDGKRQTIKNTEI